VQADRYLRDEEMRKQEELTRKQEAIRRKTLEYEAELRQQTELARVKAETEGMIRWEPRVRNACIKAILYVILLSFLSGFRGEKRELD